jgi:broad specificity phosphatase PhoE
MTQIWIVRHGEAAASWEKDPDPGLSMLGQQQAEKTAHALLDLVPEGATLLSSPLKRAQETAAAFAQKYGAPVSVETYGIGAAISSQGLGPVRVLPSFSAISW